MFSEGIQGKKGKKEERKKEEEGESVPRMVSHNKERDRGTKRRREKRETVIGNKDAAACRSSSMSAIAKGYTRTWWPSDSI